MQIKLRTYLSAIAAAALTVACGGGGDGDASNAGIPGNNDQTVPKSGNTSFAACFTLPDAGKVRTVTATSTLPVEVNIATLTSLGDQPFEGQSYPALDVHNRVDQILGSDEHHALYMLPSAPFLPAGAISYPSAGDKDPQVRYAYTYKRMTLEQLRTAMINGQVTHAPRDHANPGFGYYLDGLVFRNLNAVVPALSDFQLNVPVTLLMLDKGAFGTDPLPAGFKSMYIPELTITYSGREDVTVNGTVYSNACKLDVGVRRAIPDGYTWDIIASDATHGSAWFAPGVGLVKASVPVFPYAGAVSATVSPAQ